MVGIVPFERTLVRLIIMVAASAFFAGGSLVAALTWSDKARPLFLGFLGVSFAMNAVALFFSIVELKRQVLLALHVFGELQ
jgi:hypothetical protein